MKAQNSKSFARVFLVLLSAVALLSCGGGGGGSDDSPPAFDATGAWSGNWQSSVNDISGTFSATIEQSGSVLTGTINVPYIGMQGASLKGSAHGTKITFGDIDNTITFTGTVTGNSGSGTYTFPSIGNKGAWQGSNGAGLSAPTGVSIMPGNRQATIFWNAVDGATIYNLYRSTSPGFTLSSANQVMSLWTSATGTQSLTNKWLTNNTTTYYFVVTASNNDGLESAASSEVNALPLGTYPLPATPTGVSANAGPNSGEVTVNFTSVPGATMHCVYRATTANSMPTYLTLEGHLSSCSILNPVEISSLIAGTTYYFVVTSWTLDGESEPSAEVLAVAL